MSKNTKIAIVSLAVVLFVAVLVFTVGKKAQAPSSVSTNPSSSSAIQMENANVSATANDSTLEDLPQPTGKVDDTVNAIIDGASKENSQVTSDEQDAKSATATDAEAVTDLGAGL